MEIKKMFINHNKTKAPNREIKYIVIHDTGNKNKGANVEAHFKFFNEANRGASADFFVDDKIIGQFTDYKNEYAWHCGDGKGRNSITNANSVGIEICVNEDGDYKKAFNNAVELTRYLMKELNISINHVVRHFDASGKLCPASMADNNWAKWKEFKELLVNKKKYGITTASLLNVRIAPSTRYGKIVKQYPKNTKVEILEETDGWYKTKDGWINKGYVKVIK